MERIATGFQFTEGPVWHPNGYLLFTDIPANQIFKWTPDGNVETFRNPSGNANGLTFDQEGRLVVCEHTPHRVTRTELDGTITVLVEAYQGKRLNSPNDVIVKSDGSIYFTDPTFGVRGQRELNFQGVYRIAPDGELTLLVDDFVQPNGLAFSPDETILYIDDSSRSHIRAFDMLPNGELGAERTLPGRNVWDGMKVDTAGNLYVTGAGTRVFSPTGEHLGTIETPEGPANCAFGDADNQTLYITAGTSVYRVRLKIPGATGGLTAVTVRGKAQTQWGAVKIQQR